MIISGYQGIGKSTLASKLNRVIDLESTCFWNNEVTPKKRPEDWFVYYGQIAIDLSKQGYIVFVACHPAVRDWLCKNHGSEKFCLIFPSPTLKDDWINRLQARYEASKLEKDLAALTRAKDYYNEDIDVLVKSKDNGYNNVFMIDDINYELKDIVVNLENN